MKDIGDEDLSPFLLPGDPKHAHRRNNRSQRWGSRKLLVRRDLAPINGGSNGQVTFVDTPLFDLPTLFYLQVRFAAVEINQGQTPNPLLPFSSISSDLIRFTVRRQLDEYGGLITDTYDVNGNSTALAVAQWFPMGVISGRKIQILAEDIDTNPGHGNQYVDVYATPVTSIDDQLLIAERDNPDGQNVFGYSHGNSFRTVATAGPAVQILPADASRRQFIVTNESNQRLALSFSGNPPVVTAGLEDWSVILDPKGGARPTFVSEMDSYWGEVLGIWEPGPPLLTGFAMAYGATFIR